MTGLLAKLSSWPGRRATEQALQTRGYFLPRHYRALLVNGFKCDDYQALDQYWDETAMEYMCSGGRVNSDRREFSGPTLYRSAYLDDLARRVMGEDLGPDGFCAGRGLALDPCIRRTHIAAFRGKGECAAYFKSCFEGLEKIKQAEAHALGINTDGWVNTKTAIAKYFRKIATTRGFALCGKYCERLLPQRYVLRCYIDTGGRSGSVGHLPICFEAIGDGKVYNLREADCLIPGYSYYKNFDHPETGALGVHAHLELFDVIAKQLGPAYH